MPSMADWLGTRRELPAFVRWQQEAEKHERAGDYAWLAERLAPCRVLEIGCGGGFGTRALQRRGFSVLALEPEGDCIAIASTRCAEDPVAAGSGMAPEFLQARVGALDPAMRQAVTDFAPEWVVCWLIGADDAVLDPALPPAQAVQQYREAVHRQVAELAAALPSVRGVQLADRTVFPWKIKDTARETLLLYHRATTFSGQPFGLAMADAVYRKLDERQWPATPGQRLPAGAVPVLGSLLAYKH